MSSRISVARCKGNAGTGSEQTTINHLLKSNTDHSGRWLSAGMQPRVICHRTQCSRTPWAQRQSPSVCPTHSISSLILKYPVWILKRQGLSSIDKQILGLQARVCNMELVFCLVNTFVYRRSLSCNMLHAPMMDSVNTSETSVCIYQITWRNIREQITLLSDTKQNNCSI